MEQPIFKKKHRFLRNTYTNYKQKHLIETSFTVKKAHERKKLCN